MPISKQKTRHRTITLLATGTVFLAFLLLPQGINAQNCIDVTWGEENTLYNETDLKPGDKLPDKSIDVTNATDTSQDIGITASLESGGLDLLDLLFLKITEITEDGIRTVVFGNDGQTHFSELFDQEIYLSTLDPHQKVTYELAVEFPASETRSQKQETGFDLSFGCLVGDVEGETVTTKWVGPDEDGSVLGTLDVLPRTGMTISVIILLVLVSGITRELRKRTNRL